MSSTDYFVVSQLISVARQVRYFKLGSKPSWHHTSRISFHRAISNLSVSEGIMCISIIFFCLHIHLTATGVLNSLEEFCITRVATNNSLWECSNTPEVVGAYILSSRDIRCITTLHQCGLTQDFFKMGSKLSWFYISRISCQRAISNLSVSKGIYIVSL